MAAAERMDQPAEVATKVLRRAQVSKMTRKLQDRLALGIVKYNHGWESLSLDTLEPRVDELKRKRPGSSNETMSDASSVSEHFYQHPATESSPLAAPIFSDDIQRSSSRNSRCGSSHSQTAKRPRYAQQFDRYPATSNHNRTKVRTATTSASSWKSFHRLPESSPVCHRRHARFGKTHTPSLSLVSESSTIPDEPRSPLLSEDDDEDLPTTSYRRPMSDFHSIPHARTSPPRAPRTPPPGVARSARSARLRQNGFNAAGVARDGRNGEEDANLLMYLATSPSPAQRPSSKARMPAPSTPPPKATPLPSSMMGTPGGGGAPFALFGLSTPNVNFAEFLNMSPSPAQVGGSWNRTPVIGPRTPAASRETRHRLNIDTLLPPTSHANLHASMGRVRPKVEGLGMDLGGELGVN